MSTSRMTFGAILSTVQTTANTLTNTLAAANTGVGMLTSFVEEAAQDQQLRNVANREVFLEDLIREKTQERATANIAVEKFIGQSPAHAKHYESAYTMFSQLLRKPTE